MGDRTSEAPLDPDVITADLEADIRSATHDCIEQIMRARKVNRRTAAVLFARWLKGCKID
jgi:hypothetical protein